MALAPLVRIVSWRMSTTMTVSTWTSPLSSHRQMTQPSVEQASYLTLYGAQIGQVKVLYTQPAAYLDLGPVVGPVVSRAANMGVDTSPDCAVAAKHALHEREHQADRVLCDPSPSAAISARRNKQFGQRDSLVSLALVGPGAWSVDARLFGWKRINVHDREG